MKSTPSAPAKSLGNFFSTGSIVPGSGMLSPQKNSLDLKICMCRGIKSPRLRRIKYNWSTSDFPGHKASPKNDVLQILIQTRFSQIQEHPWNSNSACWKKKSQTDFQLKFSTPGILAAIRSPEEKVWNYNTSVNGFQKFLCMVDGHEKTDFWL